jgi:hypothetical protein
MDTKKAAGKKACGFFFDWKPLSNLWLELKQPRLEICYENL